MGRYGTIQTYPCGNKKISTWFLNITVCIRLVVECGTQNIFSHMYLEYILCLTIVVHGYVWYYAYLSMWKHANFQVVFDYYCLYRVGIGMGDPKYL
jgi:hypothetical protein